MFLIILTSVVLFVFWALKDSRRPSNFPPGPNWLPFVGNITTIAKKLKITGYHHLVWDDMIKTYGPIVGLKLGKRKVVLISDTDLIKEVSIRDEFQGRPDGFYWRLRAQGGRLGIVFNDGPDWIEQRKFSLIHLKKLGIGSTAMEDLIIAEILYFIEWLKTNSDSPINISRIFTIPVLNIIWTLIAGKRYDRKDKKLLTVCKSIDDNFQRIDTSGGILHHFPILRFIVPKASGYEALLANNYTMWNFLTETIDEHKQTIQPGKTRDFIDAYLHEINHENNDNTTFTNNQLHVVCLDFLQAGSDTTGNTLEFLIFYLTQNQEVQQKVYMEIDQVVGKCAQPNYEDRLRMSYTSAVIMEVQRLANIAPTGVPHRANSDAQLAGYKIPKDSTILLLFYNMHMDKNWEDPDIFRPERFLDDQGNLISNDRFAPFGIGKRRCPGENLARKNIFLFCVYLLQYFNLLPAPSFDINKKIEIVNGITLSPKSFEIIFKPRIK
ncbi:methyl farnesoate epoxidase-like [Arctopsyche grandis]|uniref:methyl farnesoate epoxidase-like n=1 Tax=Arctopsyche grandis TaxID=121162 RepID=UPI00406D97C3